MTRDELIDDILMAEAELGADAATLVYVGGLLIEATSKTLAFRHRRCLKALAAS